MEAKHTPGEWQVADFIANHDNSRHLAVWKGEERVICLVSPKEKEDEQDLANAKLITAAPDLLEACLTAKAMYEAQGITADSMIGGEQYTDLLIAIKKATE